MVKSQWVNLATQTTGWAPPAGLSNTSSSSNLVFPGGLPSRYWPAQPYLASVDNRSWAAGWYGCWQKCLNELFSTSYPHFCQSITYWMLTNQGSVVDIQLRLRYSQSLKPCELQQLILNNQFSFSFSSAAFDTVNHHILLSTLSSLDITGIPLRWFKSYLNGRSRWPGSLGFLRDRFLDPSSSPHTLHHWVPSYKHMVSHSIAMLMALSHFDQMIQR